MKAGPALDALVAEKVMGLNVRLDGLDQSRYRMGWYDQAVPRYSTDIAATWEVVDLLNQRLGPTLDFFLSRCETEVSSGWICRFGNEECSHETSIIVEGMGVDTAPLAICLAALKAMGA